MAATRMMTPRTVMIPPMMVTIRALFLATGSLHVIRPMIPRITAMPLQHTARMINRTMLVLPKNASMPVRWAGGRGSSYASGGRDTTDLLQGGQGGAALGA